MMRWWFVQKVRRRSQNCCVGIMYEDTASKSKRGCGGETGGWEGEDGSVLVVVG
jgi:hypothetical protein